MTRLFLLSLAASSLIACGPPSPIDSSVRIGSTATLEKRDTTWFFLAPLDVSLGAASADWRLGARVVELGGSTFIEEFSAKDLGKPNTFAVPLRAYRDPTRGTKVTLQVTALVHTWDGTFAASTASAMETFVFQF